MAARVTAIKHGWSWKERDLSIISVLDEVNSPWTNAATFPSEIHVELLKAGRIPDPFKGFNEHEVQCESHILASWGSDVATCATSAGIGEREWLYHTKFDVPESEHDQWKNAELVFEGLDTLCDVYLVSPACASCSRSTERHPIPSRVEREEDPIRRQHVSHLDYFALARRSSGPRQSPSASLQIREEAREGA